MVHKKMPRKLPNLTKNEHSTNTLFLIFNNNVPGNVKFNLLKRLEK